MLREAQIGPAIQSLLKGDRSGSPVILLLLGFGSISSPLKIAQGASSVAMITTSEMLAAMLTEAGPLPFHLVYLQPPLPAARSYPG